MQHTYQGDQNRPIQATLQIMYVCMSWTHLSYRKFLYRHIFPFKYLFETSCLHFSFIQIAKGQQNSKLFIYFLSDFRFHSSGAIENKNLFKQISMFSSKILSLYVYCLIYLDLIQFFWKMQRKTWYSIFGLDAMHLSLKNLLLIEVNLLYMNFKSKPNIDVCIDS